LGGRRDAGQRLGGGLRVREHVIAQQLGDRAIGVGRLGRQYPQGTQRVFLRDGQQYGPDVVVVDPIHQQRERLIGRHRRQRPDHPLDVVGAFEPAPSSNRVRLQQRRPSRADTGPTGFHHSGRPRPHFLGQKGRHERQHPWLVEQQRAEEVRVQVRLKRVAHERGPLRGGLVRRRWRFGQRRQHPQRAYRMPGEHAGLQQDARADPRAEVRDAECLPAQQRECLVPRRLTEQPQEPFVEEVPIFQAEELEVGRLGQMQHRVRSHALQYGSGLAMAFLRVQRPGDVAAQQIEVLRRARGEEQQPVQLVVVRTVMIFGRMRAGGLGAVLVHPVPPGRHHVGGHDPLRRRTAVFREDGTGPLVRVIVHSAQAGADGAKDGDELVHVVGAPGFLISVGL
jgi:hypothetical protein